MKLSQFDLYQKVILIVGILSVIATIIVFLLMNAQAIITYDELGIIASIKFPLALQSLFSIFFFLNILCVTWFIIRQATSKLREKEYNQ
jgi:cytochrome bd-type quinol oxidase subunit 2